MDEGARLESVWTGNCLVSSNLTLSAIKNIGLAVLDGEVAVPCYPQTAAAGLNSCPRD